MPEREIDPAPEGWTPPVMQHNYGTQLRLVTQADYDRLEKQVGMLMIHLYTSGETIKDVLEANHART